MKNDILLTVWLKSILFASLFLMKPLSFAENTLIFKCGVKNSHWKAMIQLDAVGDASLKFLNNETKENKTSEASAKSYSCGLKINYIKDGTGSVIPEMMVEFERVRCEPTLPMEMEKKILKAFLLSVELTNKEKPVGFVQWVKRRPLDKCLVSALNLFEFQLAAKKWKEGKWGQNKSSDL